MFSSDFQEAKLVLVDLYFPFPVSLLHDPRGFLSKMQCSDIHFSLIGLCPRKAPRGQPVFCWSELVFLSLSYGEGIDYWAQHCHSWKTKTKQNDKEVDGTFPSLSFLTLPIAYFCFIHPVETGPTYFSYLTFLLNNFQNELFPQLISNIFFVLPFNTLYHQGKEPFNSFIHLWIQIFKECEFFQWSTYIRFTSIICYQRTLNGFWCTCFSIPY